MNINHKLIDKILRDVFSLAAIKVFLVYIDTMDVRCCSDITIYELMNRAWIGKESAIRAREELESVGLITCIEDDCTIVNLGCYAP